MKPLDMGERQPANSSASRMNSGSRLTVEDDDKIEQKSLAQLQNERRRVESDAVILANRLALLRHEDTKTSKKIDDTKRKAFEIYQRKREIEDRKKKRKEEEEEHYRSLQTNQKDTLNTKHESQDKIVALRGLIQHERHREYLDMRSQQEIFQKQREEARLRESEERKNKVEMVREMKNKALKRLENYQLEREQLAKQNYEEKKKREAARKAKLKLEIIDMERRENELLSLLQQRQTIHRDAYVQLEDALAMPTQDFVKRYHQYAPMSISPKEKRVGAGGGLRRGGLGNRSTLLHAFEKGHTEVTMNAETAAAYSQPNLNRTVEPHET